MDVAQSHHFSVPDHHTVEKEALDIGLLGVTWVTACSGRVKWLHVGKVWSVKQVS